MITISILCLLIIGLFGSDLDSREEPGLISAGKAIGER